MDSNSHTTHSTSGFAHGSLSTYLFGFLSSLLCTGAAFGLVEWDLSTHQMLLAHGALLFVIIILAITQLVAQLVFFLHLGKGSKTHWNVTVFAFAILIVSIVVGGSLWIMSNLKHTSMTDMYIGGVVSPATQAN